MFHEFRKFLKDSIVHENYSAIPDGEIILRVSATELEYQFWIQPNEEKAIQIGTALTKDISTEIIYGFIGTYIGMYATGNGSANTNPADFDWFDFEKDSYPPYKWN